MGAGNVTARRRRLISLSGEQVLQLSGRDQEERDRDRDGGRERERYVCTMVDANRLRKSRGNK